MGLLLLAPQSFEEYNSIIFGLDYVQGLQNNGELLYQGLVLDQKMIYKTVVCLYIRKTPNDKETLEIANRFQYADCIIGDLNLNPAVPNQSSNLSKVCGSTKGIALMEITTINDNQLDHILLDKSLIKRCFSTSYFNLASDHKPIVLRIPLPGNQFSATFLEKKNFDSDHHLKTKMNKENENDKLRKRQNMDDGNLENKVIFNNKHKVLRFLNPPGTNLCFSNAAASCLLNIPELNMFLNEVKNKNIDQNSIAGELRKLSSMTNYTLATTERLRSIVETKCFEKEQWTKNFNNNGQHDSGEFIQSLFEHLWSHQATPPALKDEVFGGLCQNTLYCNCGHEEELQVQYMPEVIPIQIKGNSIQSCLDDYFAAEDVKWSCPQCKLSPVLRKSSVIEGPNTLILQLMRYKYEDVKQILVKISDAVNCPESVWMPNGISYSLISVINHIGEETKSGHYNMVLCDQVTHQSILLDDCVVSKVENLNQEINRLSYIFIYRKNNQ